MRPLFMWRIRTGSNGEPKRGNCDFSTPNQLRQTDAKNAQLSGLLAAKYNHGNSDSGK
jgi:hypothetical protein